MRRPRRNLARRRRECGLTQEELAYALRIDRSTVARWEAGETEPQPWLRPKLAAALDLSTHALAGLLGNGAPERAPDDSAPQPAAVDADDVGRLHGRVGDIARSYATQPSASLLAEAGQCHAALRLLLEHGPASCRKALHQALTASATLLCQLIWDASGRRDRAAALAFCEEASVHATACGDVVAEAHAQLRRTYVALYSPLDVRDPSAALATAQSAAATSRAVSPALSGLAGLHVAEAWAMQGEFRRCEQALDAAGSQLEQVRPDDPAGDVQSPGQYGRLAGSCYLALGLPERAEPLLSRTADSLRDRPKTRSLVLGNLALSQLRQRHLESATATLHEAVDLLDVSRGGGGMTVVFGAARELYPWRAEPAVQDVHDRLLALVARN